MSGDNSRTTRFGARGGAYWAAYFFAWVIGLVAIGALAGAVTFPPGGLLLGVEKSVGELAVRGARFMSFIFMIWAPAVALVACVMKAWKRNAARKRANGAGRAEA